MAKGWRKDVCSLAKIEVFKRISDEERLTANKRMTKLKANASLAYFKNSKYQL